MKTGNQVTSTELHTSLLIAYVYYTQIAIIICHLAIVQNSMVLNGMQPVGRFCQNLKKYWVQVNSLYSSKLAHTVGMHKLIILLQKLGELGQIFGEISIFCTRTVNNRSRQILIPLLFGCRKMQISPKIAFVSTRFQSIIQKLEVLIKCTLLIRPKHLPK
jgi:hypothetical protein